MPEVSLNRTGFFFLAVALAFSVILALPVEQITHDGYPPAEYWPHSCSDAMIGLNLANIAQALLTPFFVFLLPGPGSLFQRKVRPSIRFSAKQVPARRLGPLAEAKRSGFSLGALATPAMAVVFLVVGALFFLRSGWALKTVNYFPGHSTVTVSLLRSVAFLEAIFEAILGFAAIGVALSIFRDRISIQVAHFVVAGWLAATAFAVMAWYALADYPGMREGCPALYDWTLPVHSRQPDYVSDFFHYFVCLSLFAGFWTGIGAGALRAQSARASGKGSSKGPMDLPAFGWACFLGWAVQYRISQWFAALQYRTSQEWVFWSAMNFVFVIASSLWVLAFVRRMWNKQARSWRLAVWQPFWISLVIYLLTVLTFIGLVIYAVMPLVPPIMTFNVFGSAWALTIGTWRWRIVKNAAVHVTALPE